MRRLTRIALRIVAGLILSIIIVITGFRLWSLMREDQGFRAAAGQGAAFVQADGLALHYRNWGPADGRPLILLHGSLAWSETFRDIAVPLGARGFRVIALDMPPFGYSERPAGHDYSRSAQARRLLAFADALELKTFVLAVHSYGGGGAIEAALAAPERFEALVLLDVALGLGDRSEPSPPAAPLLGLPVVGDALVAATFSNPLMIGFGLRDFVHDDAIVNDERIALYVRPYAVEGFTEAVRHWLFSGLYGDERGSKTADIANWTVFDRPVLVIWGREDTVTPLPQGEAIAKAFPKARLVVLDGVNHIPHVEKPDEVVDAIGAFLGEPAAAPDMPRLRGAMR